MISEYVCVMFQKKILKLPAFRANTVSISFESPYLRSLQSYGCQVMLGKLEKRVRKHVLAILTTRFYNNNL